MREIAQTTTASTDARLVPTETRDRYHAALVSIDRGVLPAEVDELLGRLARRGLPLDKVLSVLLHASDGQEHGLSEMPRFEAVLEPAGRDQLKERRRRVVKAGGRLTPLDMLLAILEGRASTEVVEQSGKVLVGQVRLPVAGSVAGYGGAIDKVRNRFSRFEKARSAVDELYPVADPQLQSAVDLVRMRMPPALTIASRRPLDAFAQDGAAATALRQLGVGRRLCRALLALASRSHHAIGTGGKPTP